MSSLNQLRTMINDRERRTGDKIIHKPEPTPIDTQFDGPLPGRYRTVRNNVTKDIYALEQKKDQIIYKDHPDDAHSSSMTLAKFKKFYHLVE
jgi:hypothetical protein